MYLTSDHDHVQRTACGPPIIDRPTANMQVHARYVAASHSLICMHGMLHAMRMYVRPYMNFINATCVTRTYRSWAAAMISNPRRGDEYTCSIHASSAAVYVRHAYSYARGSSGHMCIQSAARVHVRAGHTAMYVATTPLKVYARLANIPVARA